MVLMETPNQWSATASNNLSMLAMYRILYSLFIVYYRYRRLIIDKQTIFADVLLQVSLAVCKMIFTPHSHTAEVSSVNGRTNLMTGFYTVYPSIYTMEYDNMGR